VAVRGRFFVGSPFDTGGTGLGFGVGCLRFALILVDDAVLALATRIIC
jgi:hypothetical protein